MIELKDFVDVNRKAEDLGCNLPTSIAVLPRNFEDAKSKDELVHEDTTSTIRSLWRQNGINETPLEKEAEHIPEIIEESFQWIGPIILFTSAVITQNPSLVDISLSVIANYLTDFFKGIAKGEEKASLDIVVQKKNGSCKKIHYEGTPKGLKDLPEIVRRVYDE